MHKTQERNSLIDFIINSQEPSLKFNYYAVDKISIREINSNSLLVNYSIFFSMKNSISMEIEDNRKVPHRYHH